MMFAIGAVARYVSVILAASAMCHHTGWMWVISGILWGVGALLEKASNGHER